MFFKNRIEAGILLAQKLKRYEGETIIVYGLPRGGVVTAAEIAQSLSSPLSLIITRKIGHPANAEYAVAATAENGNVIKNPEVFSIDDSWLQKAAKREQEEAKRRREKYLRGRKPISVANRFAILVDDGAATGLTIRAGIKELRQRNPKKLIVAVPIIPEETYEILQQEADEVVALAVPSTDEFLGAVGAYYESFPEVKDEEVIRLLDKLEANYLFH